MFGLQRRPQAMKSWLISCYLASVSGFSEIVVDDVRVQALSSHLVRIEPKGPKGFEDRTTFMVASRKFSGLKITNSSTENGTLLSTDYYQVLLRTSRVGGSCSDYQEGVDVTNPVRSAKYPNGATGVGSASQCCDVCSGDPGCTAWVFVYSFKGCYLLASYNETVAGSGRAVGSRAGSASFQVTSKNNEVLFDTQHDARSSRLHWPAPLTSKAYGVVDQPRFFVPDWGCAPVPPDAEVDDALIDSNGYDYGNQVAGDTYIFVLGSDLATYNSARKDFVELTGSPPILPDYAYGTWFTWWNQYTEETAKADIQKWEQLKLPLDIWGLDIDWRGVTYPDHMHEPHQCDYDHPDNRDFVDFDEWFQFLRNHSLRTYHNDHPCPQAPQTNPVEISYRYDGLGKWLGKGMTFWWYDHNWYLGIPPPWKAKADEDWDGLTTPAWGSHVFWTVTKYFDQHVRKPKGDTWYDRTMLLSKSFKPDWRPGMDPMKAAEHPSHHRYGAHWTGDYVNLQASVESMVDAGLHSFKPYVHSDCGGDYGQKDPNPDDVTSAGGLLRWTSHCAYGSILRFHGADHRVWKYDMVTQTTFRNYLTARHWLIPTILSAAKHTARTGHPLVARLDLEWPEHSESRSNSQYLFLDDILLAPIFESTVSSRHVWIPPGNWQDAWDPSLVVTGPKTITASQPAHRIPMWHRRDGGLLLLANDKKSTRVETQDWSSLSVEAFPSTAAANSSRHLHERNGAGSTCVELHTDGHGGVRVLIGEAPVKRSWVVRLHLRPGERVTSASIDGVKILSTVAQLHLEPNADEASYFPLLGAGNSPPKGSGAVAELHVQASAKARTVHAKVEMESVVV